MKVFQVTVPFPIPIVGRNADPEVSWQHILEQSGILLVPNSFANNWYTNEASLLVLLKYKKRPHPEI